MRTTVTLDPDTEQILRARMQRDGVGFKRALNDAVRASDPERPAPKPFRTKTFNMGEALVDLTHANAVLAELDDEAFLELEDRLKRGDE